MSVPENVSSTPMGPFWPLVLIIRLKKMIFLADHGGTIAIQCGNLKCMLINVIDFLSLHIHFRIVKVNVVFSPIHTKYDFQR